eukprot:GHVL01021080.1.p2 GENE.GHVL01021080.1~~GHVL01021080.1.p2  ORF type:complete len:189 (+),score=58.78 GHVL01021080.1:410-976(+)
MTQYNISENSPPRAIFLKEPTNVYKDKLIVTSCLFYYFFLFFSEKDMIDWNIPDLSQSLIWLTECLDIIQYLSIKNLIYGKTNDNETVNIRYPPIIGYHETVMEPLYNSLLLILIWINKINIIKRQIVKTVINRLNNIYLPFQFNNIIKFIKYSLDTEFIEDRNDHIIKCLFPLFIPPQGAPPGLNDP